MTAKVVMSTCQIMPRLAADISYESMFVIFGAGRFQELNEIMLDEFSDIARTWYDQHEHHDRRLVGTPTTRTCPRPIPRVCPCPGSRLRYQITRWGR